jgi:serine/alanine adding enzyme
MKLFITKDIDPILWTEFLKKHPNANIFQSPEIYEVYKTTKNYVPIVLSVVNENNEICGILMSVFIKEQSSILGKLSARSIIWGGPIVKDKNLKILDFLLNEYIKVIKNRVIYTQFRNLWAWDENELKVFAKNEFHFIEHLDIVHNLSLNPNEMMKKMHRGRRKNIRRAIKQEIEFEQIRTKEEFTEAIALIKNTYTKIKLPMPNDSLFHSAFILLFPKGLVKFFVAKYDSKIIGTRFVFCYNDLIYDWFSGASDLFMDKYPNDFLPWKIMEWGHFNGYRVFDFGGAGKPTEKYGVRDYKLRFGGELVNWGRFERVHNRALYSIGKTALKIFKHLN